MCMCMYNTHIHMYTCTHIHMHSYAHIHIYTYTHIHTYTKHIHTYMHIYIYIHMRAWMDGYCLFFFANHESHWGLCKHKTYLSQYLPFGGTPCEDTSRTSYGWWLLAIYIYYICILSPYDGWFPPFLLVNPTKVDPPLMEILHHAGYAIERHLGKSSPWLQVFRSTWIPSGNLTFNS